VQDVPTRLKIGFSFCIIEAANIAVNLLLAFSFTFKELIYKIRLYMAKKGLLR